MRVWFCLAGFLATLVLPTVASQVFDPAPTTLPAPDVGPVTPIPPIPVPAAAAGMADTASRGLGGAASALPAGSVPIAMGGGPGLPVSVKTGPSLGVHAPGPASTSRDPFAPAPDAPPLQQVGTGVAGASILFGAGALLVRLLGLTPMPLFSRIEDDLLLANPVRKRLHEAIAQTPGRTIQELRALAGCAWGTAVHHLLRLERHGLAVSHRDGGARRYFPANTLESRSRRELSVMAHPTTERIARLVSESPGIDQKGICGALGLRNPSASKHLRRLERFGLVATTRVSRSCFYEPTSTLAQVLALEVGVPPGSPLAGGLEAAESVPSVANPADGPLPVTG